ncbi:class I SAM-dependent methyltransferase [Streptomyces humi]|uniref:class I SAM-dependent methyltransferase n=1 Tax=Streptomyces humi TaxID=1428620 RepID=UPI0006288C73|nr:class I SAM-dependent methyltransferase [Streptomyces humi]
MSTLWELMHDCIPDDHARQVTSRYYLDEAMRGPRPPDRVVDLGCGRGASAGLFRSHDPRVRWVGLDIRDSPEAAQRTPGGDAVVHFDGVNMPFRSDAVPLVYSHQVFEHVARPRELLAEVGRVLRPGGLFIGSTSQFEPYHSFSLWNYTPYGFRVLVEEAGLTLEEVRPSLDGVTLIMRSYHDSRKQEYGRFWRRESPLNTEIDAWARTGDRRAALVNLRKLMFCGQFAFRVTKPGTPP